jgi:hypothetical protein
MCSGRSNHNRILLSPRRSPTDRINQHRPPSRLDHRHLLSHPRTVATPCYAPNWPCGSGQVCGPRIRGKRLRSRQYSVSYGDLLSKILALACVLVPDLANAFATVYDRTLSIPKVIVYRVRTRFLHAPKLLKLRTSSLTSTLLLLDANVVSDRQRLEKWKLSISRQSWYSPSILTRDNNRHE